MEWDKFQVDLQYTIEVPKLTFVKLTSRHILQLLSLTAWGVGSIPLNMQAKLKHDEDFALMIRVTRAGYAKTLKGAWMERD